MQNVYELAVALEALHGTVPTVIVAIDGCGGAGKSTLAASLNEHWEGSAVVHTDDFASWDQPLNWWPRLLHEVLEPLAKGHNATFQKYDWVERKLHHWETISSKRVILEGVSSSRREFRPYLAYSIWVETSRQERLRRGLERDGQDAIDLWHGWMAAEDSYVADHHPRGYANLILDGEDAFRFMGSPSQL